MVCWRDDPAAALAKIDYHCRNQLVFTGGKREQRHFHSASSSQVDGRRGHDRSACRAPVLSPRVVCPGAPAYNPAARFDLAVSEVEFRRNSAGRMLMARIYQPKGPGPFPTVLDLHGGAW